jgi:uncharacterized protein (TIGR02246 family)
MLTRSDEVKLVSSLVAVAALGLTVAGCQRPTPQMADTRAAAEAAIRAVYDDQLKAVAAMDTVKAVSGYTDDAVFMSPDAPLVRGKADVQKTFEAMLKDKPEFSMDAPKIEVAKSGDLAYEWVTGKMALKNEKGKLNETTFKSLTAWKKQADGSWKMMVDTFIPGPAPKGN